jgi:hypothetical protein
MTKHELRQIVYNKYMGKCAYTGKPLGDDWQIDHAESKYLSILRHTWEDVNDICNLEPVISIVNHYKRAKDIEMFREYMLTFHIRLSKLPKKTLVDATVNRINYMNRIAELFDITPDKPFCGKFYFETL